MRLSVCLFFLLLMMLVDVSFAQSVWDNYRTTESVQSEKVEPVALHEENDGKAENQKITYIQNQKQWYVGNSRATPEVIEALLKTNPEAAEEVSSAKLYFKWGVVCSLFGGAALGAGLGLWDKGNKDIGRPFTFGGSGVVALALILASKSWSHTHAAVEIYNKSHGYTPSMYLSVVPTSQGGVALALAF